MLKTCPFNPEHERPAVIELAGGALVYKCLHSSCQANDWRALRSLFEPGYAEPKPAVDAADPGPEDDRPLVTDLSQIPSVWSLEIDLKWCVDEMIGQGSVTLICAESGTGKTWLGYYIAGCIAHGFSVIGRTSQRGKVLYLDGENPLAVVKQRLLDLGIGETADLTVWGGWVSQPPPGPDHPLVVEFARTHRGLIIYDSLVEFHPGCEQSSTETRAFMRHFRRLANLGATVVVLHHTGKAETAKQYRGSSDIKAAVDTAYLLEKPPGAPEELGKLLLTCFKGRLMPGQDFAMEFKNGLGFLPSAYVPPKKSVEQVVAEILEANPGLNQSEIVAKARDLGMKKSQVESCLKRGPWDTEPGPRHSTLYYPRPKGSGGGS